MFTTEIIKQLKQNNISVDAEKTKTRTAGIWKNSSRENQEAALALADVSRATIQRVYKTGSISAKLTVPMAQTLNVNPFFFTGESDDPGECTDELLKELLEKHGYEALIKANAAAERKRIRREKRDGTLNLTTQPESATETEERFDRDIRAALDSMMEAYFGDEVAIDEGVQALADALTEEDMVLLLKSVLLRAKAGGKYAALAAELKLLLIS